MELYQMLQEFREESFEWIESMESSLLLLEKTKDSSAVIKEILRDIQALKSSVGLFALDDAFVMLRELENMVVRVSNGDFSFDENLITLLLSCCSHLRILIGETDSEWKGRDHVQIKNNETKLMSGIERYSAVPISSNHFRMHVPGMSESSHLQQQLLGF
jgi:two-component system chemotaxis sensor kinase CheA